MCPQAAACPGCPAPCPPRSGCWTRPPSGCLTSLRGPPSAPGTCALCCQTAPSWSTEVRERTDGRRLVAGVGAPADLPAPVSLPPAQAVRRPLHRRRPPPCLSSCRRRGRRRGGARAQGRGVARAAGAARHCAPLQRRLLPKGHQPARHGCAAALLALALGWRGLLGLPAFDLGSWRPLLRSICAARMLALPCWPRCAPSYCHSHIYAAC